MQAVRVGRRVTFGLATIACLVTVTVNSGNAFAEEFDPAEITSDLARLTSAQNAVKAYARDYDVTATRAQAVLEMQARGTDLSEVLPEALGSSFGQVWFRDGRYDVYVQKGGDVALARELLAERGVSSTAIVREVPWNAADLRRELGAVHGRLPHQSDADEAFVATADGGLEITLARSASDATARAAADAGRRTASEAGVPVDVVRADHELGTPTRMYALPGYGGPPWIAGMLNRPTDDSAGSCTTGFYARAIGNYFLTAGHCIGNRTPYRKVFRSPGSPVNVGIDVGGFDNTWGDAGVIASWDVMAPYPAMLDWTNPVNPAIAVFGASLSTNGFFYCHTGVGSHLAGHSATTCGTNRGYGPITFPGYPNEVFYRQIYRGNTCGWVGDSGGPVWDPFIGHAIGIFEGGQGGSAFNGGCGTNMILYYTDAKPAAATLGVTIATIY
ncbi:MAG: hypothetical protein WBD40_04480 [Tepidisphaeraceae bacterium]